MKPRHDVREYVSAALSAGWRVEKTGKSHFKFVPADPTKPVVVHAGTSCSQRGLKNFIAALRRSGLEV